MNSRSSRAFFAHEASWLGQGKLPCSWVESICFCYVYLGSLQYETEGFGIPGLVQDQHTIEKSVPSTKTMETIPRKRVKVDQGVLNIEAFSGFQFRSFPYTEALTGWRELYPPCHVGCCICCGSLEIFQPFYACQVLSYGLAKVTLTSLDAVLMWAEESKSKPPTTTWRVACD